MTATPLWLLLASGAACAAAGAAPRRGRQMRREVSVVDPAGHASRPLEELVPSLGNRSPIAEPVQDLAAVAANESHKIGSISTCQVVGDPHVMAFDATKAKGGFFHPMYSPGQWWLVRTWDKTVSIQGWYGKCGRRSWRGWHAIRKYGMPRTCLMGLFIGGSFLTDGAGTQHRLYVKPPCDWHWETESCRTIDKVPRIVWISVMNDDTKNTVEYVSHLHVPDPPVYVRRWHHRIDIDLPLGITIRATFAGAWNAQKIPSYMNAYIRMRSGVAGVQCGHCGNNNGNWLDDRIYTDNGELNYAVAQRLFNYNEGMMKFCDATVHCDDRMEPPRDECKENLPAASYKLLACKGTKLRSAKKACGKAFNIEHIGNGWLEHKEMRVCVEDECAGGGFARADARGAKEMLRLAFRKG